MVPSIGPMELLVVLVLALPVMEPKRLPSAGRVLGQVCANSAASSGAGSEPLPPPSSAEATDHSRIHHAVRGDLAADGKAHTRRAGDFANYLSL
jgi:hypothetical protein